MPPAFGMAVANSAINPAIALRESGLSVLYALVVGLLLATAIIRIELALSPGGGASKRAKRAEEVAGVRPEPPRTAPLL